MPTFNHFAPVGTEENREIVILTLDELEAIRLADMQGMYQEDAAQLMGISRATFGRILEEARKKVAEAIIQGKELRIQGGTVVLSEIWQETTEFCFCPTCGFRKPHTPGIPCREEICPNCGTHLLREDYK